MAEDKTVEQKRRLGWFPVSTIVPPFVNVEMVDYRDRIQLTPHYWCREFVALGKRDANPYVARMTGMAHAIAKSVLGGKKIWVIASWRRYEDGREEELITHLLDPEATAAYANKQFVRACEFQNESREELMELTRLFKATPEDIAYAESRPSAEAALELGARSIPERDLHNARLLVMEDLQPKTVELLRNAELTEDPNARQRIEYEALHAFFADLAHYWTEATIMRWQQSNPPGSNWVEYFAQVRSGKKKVLEPIDCELALNWLRKAYNLLTQEELSEAVFVTTGTRLKPATIKKRRERLGLTTDRPPGPRPNSERR